MKRIAPIAVAIAGAIHLILAPEHYAHAPAHGIFFLIVGIAEMAWAVMFLDKPTRSNYYIGLALSGGLVVLWAITRVLPAPFHGEVEAIDLGGIACKVSELTGLFALLVMAAQGSIVGLGKQSLTRLAGVAVLIASAVAGITYGVSRAAEPLLPSLSASHHEGEHEVLPDHDHAEGEEHTE
jgi:cell division protein FtsW (lipid II flippase)